MRIKEENNPKKILIVGYGGAGKRYHSNLLKILKEVQIYRLVRNGTISKKDNEDLTAISEDQAVTIQFDLVIIANPSSEHLKYATRFINNTPIMIIEKPLCTNLHEAEVFKNNLIGKNIKCYVSFQRRFMEMYSHLKELIRTNKYGKLKHAIVEISSYYPAWREPEDIKTFYAVKKELGGGVLYTECHEVDLLNWLVGPIEKVSCVLNSFSGIEVEDHSIISGLLNNSNVKIPFFLKTDFHSQIKKRMLHFSFEYAEVFLDEIQNTMSIYSDNTKVVDFDNIDCHLLFLQAVLELGPDKFTKKLATYDDGYKCQCVLEACKQSNAKGESTTVKSSVFPLEGVSIIQKVIEKSINKFGNELISIYGMGSLGYGGYIDGWSDLDIDIIVNSHEKEAVNAYATGKEIEKELIQAGFERLDIRTYNLEELAKSSSLSQFGQLCRLYMLKNSAKLIYGQDISREIISPTKSELVKESISLIDQLLNKSDDWWQERPLDDLVAFVTLPARFLYTYKYGTITGKSTALKFAIMTHQELFSQTEQLWLIWALSVRELGVRRSISSNNDSLIKSIKCMLQKAKEFMRTG